MNAEENMNEGDLIPELKLKTDRDEEYDLRSLKGGLAVVYFYPKANTPGCTTEACEFNERGIFGGKEITVVGISPDKPRALGNFRKKHDLGFVLLSDPDNVAAKAFGAFGEKKMYGKKYMGVIRSTFLFDEDGKLMRKYENVRVKGHVANVAGELAG